MFERRERERIRMDQDASQFRDIDSHCDAA
jgi:hypothetical protein